MREIVIAGAGLAGSRCAETLRARGYAGRIVLVGDEETPPYERPALSKAFLAGDKRADELLLRPPSFWQDQGIELLLGRRVIAVRDGVAWLSDGRRLTWDRFVVATGSRARRLPFAAPKGVHVLRTIRDAAALRIRLGQGTSLVVIGGGFVGAEVASTARGLGVDVVMLESEEVPFARVLGAEVGRVLAARYREHGVQLRTSALAAGFRTDANSRVNTVQLHDGASCRVTSRSSPSAPSRHVSCSRGLTACTSAEAPPVGRDTGRARRRAGPASPAAARRRRASAADVLLVGPVRIALAARRGSARRGPHGARRLRGRFRRPLSRRGGTPPGRTGSEPPGDDRAATA
jgi:thioredoxin reductase